MALSEAIGKPVSVRNIELEVYVDCLIRAGLPQAYAERFAEFYNVAIHGFNKEVANIVEMVTSHPRRSFRDYASAHF